MVREFAIAAADLLKGAKQHQHKLVLRQPHCHQPLTIPISPRRLCHTNKRYMKLGSAIGSRHVDILWLFALSVHW
jgi:hypothetical protein